MDTFLQRFPRAVMRIDDALTVLATNARAATLLGVRGPDDDGQGQQAVELTRAIAADASLGDELALTMATVDLPGTSGEEVFDWRHHERIYEVSLCKEAAGAECFLVFFVDVTDARTMERIQLEARHYLEGILADIPLGIAVLDARQRVTSVNKRMREFSRRLVNRGDLVDAIGADVADLGPADTGQRWRELCVRAMAQDAPIDDERLPLLDGELVIATRAQPLHDQRGQLTGAILVVEDVTQQAGLEAELIRMEKLATVGQMVITVNHEINNPLVIISTNAQALRLTNKSLDDKARAKLEKIEVQVKRIAEVTARLRTMDEVVANQYIDGGPTMVDIWGDKQGGEQ